MHISRDQRIVHYVNIVMEFDLQPSNVTMRRLLTHKVQANRSRINVCIIGNDMERIALNIRVSLVDS